MNISENFWIIIFQSSFGVVCGGIGFWINHLVSRKTIIDKELRSKKAEAYKKFLEFFYKKIVAKTSANEKVSNKEILDFISDFNSDGFRLEQKLTFVF